MRRALAAVAAVVLGLTLAACSKSSANTFAGAVLHQPYHAPATELTDTDGRPFSLANSTDKRLTLVFFGYTHCPDECPTTMATLASAMLQLDDADRNNVQVVFVTTDPARDTGPVIRQWLDHFSSSFVGVTGPLADDQDGRHRRRRPDREGAPPARRAGTTSPTAPRCSASTARTRSPSCGPSGRPRPSSPTTSTSCSPDDRGPP